MSVQEPSAFLKDVSKFIQDCERSGKVNLVIEMLRGMIARSKGHVNAPLHPAYVSLIHVIASKSPQVAKLLGQNTIGVSMRHLRRINAGDRENIGNILDLDPNSINIRAKDWISKMGHGSEKRVLITIAHDATKLKPRVCLHRGKYMVGFPANEHLIDIDDMRNENEDTANQFLLEKMTAPKEDLASEVKCSIMLSQCAKEGIYPAKLLCCRPQTTNEVCFNSVVESFESCYIREMMNT